MPPSNEVKMMESHFDNVTGALNQKPEVQERQYVAFFYYPRICNFSAKTALSGNATIFHVYGNLQIKGEFKLT